MVAIDKDIIFGIHSVAILDRATFKPFSGGFLQIIGKVDLNLSQEEIALYGGSNFDPFAVEGGKRESKVAFTVRQYNRGVMEKALKAEYASTNSSTTGTVSSLLNTKGTSVLNATTGIASVSALSGSEADLKAGTYIIEATSSTTVNIYATTDIQLLEGTDVTIQDQSMKLLAANVTITAAGNTTLTGLGVKVTGGSGTIGMTTGDTAIFEVAPAHGGINDYYVGTDYQQDSYVGLEFWSQRQSDGTMWRIRCPKVRLSGMPFNFSEKAFTEGDIAGTLVKATDPLTSKNLLLSVRQIKGV